MSAEVEIIPTQLQVVAALMVDRDRRMLVQQRPEGTQMAGLWEFPGGKVESAETPEAALVRELLEELGIRVEPSDLAPMTFASEPLGNRHLLLLLYKCSAWQGSPEALHAKAIRWVSLEEMRALPMPPADAPLIPVIEALLAPKK